MVTILLATLNGEDYLKAQLESIAARSLRMTRHREVPKTILFH